VTGDDLDDFAKLWRHEPSPEEQRRLESLARSTSRRARRAQRVEIAGGALLLVAVMAAFYVSPAPATLLAGSVFAAVLIWSAWKRYRLHQVALIVETSDRNILIEKSITAAELRLRRSRLGLWFLLPGYLLSAMLNYSVLHDKLTGFLQTLVNQTIPLTAKGTLTFLLLTAAMAYFGYNHRQLRRELQNLRKLRQQYQDEARLDRLAEE
jgi:hypothetical protein